jgi:thioesterase domain-containing protein
MKGSDSNEEPLTQIEEMAAQYVSDLIRFQPEGPYYIGGYSLGGTVAYEMARQLSERGLEVALLAVIDQRNFCPPRHNCRNYSTFGQFLRNVPWWFWDDFLCDSPLQMWQRLLAILRKIGIGFVRAFKVGRQTKLKITDCGWDWVARLPARNLRLLEANFSACRRYLPKSYSGRMVLIRARSQALLRLQGHDMGWAGLVHGGLEIHTVPGNHSNLCEEPQVYALAHELQRHIDAAELKLPRRITGSSQEANVDCPNTYVTQSHPAFTVLSS